MNLAEFSFAYRKLIYFSAVLLALSGVYSYFNMGWLEDPDISVKASLVIVNYPGASPEDVEREIVQVVESKLREMSQIKHISAQSADGRAIFRIDIKDEYWKDELPQVWDELRRKVRDVEPLLPASASKPVVLDDYGSVFGFVVSVTGDGYPLHEINRHARAIRRELSLLESVARIDLWGEQSRQVVIELRASDMAKLDINEMALMHALQDKNRIIDPGALELGGGQYPVNVAGALSGIEDIGNVLITVTNSQGKQEQIRIRDAAEVYYRMPPEPSAIHRVDGRQGVALAIAPAHGENVVLVGRMLDKKLAEVQAQLPVGIELKKIAWQSDYVSSGITSFVSSLVLATLIVFAVIAVTMGFRMGLLIGGVGLGLTVLGSITLTKLAGVDLHRVSLGALVVAMGMMVDNAIVVADGFVSRVRKGLSRQQAAIEAAQGPGIALLGATVVAVMAFYPTAGSPTSAAEYSLSLFIVAGLSLMLSWVISQTLIPLLCVRMIPVTVEGEVKAGVLDGTLNFLQRVIVFVLARRIAALLILVGLLLASLSGMSLVDKQFFPLAERNQFSVNYWAPQGSHINSTAEELARLEQLLREDERVVSVGSFIGQGSPRFYLPVDPELPNASYGQMLVTTESSDSVVAVVDRFKATLHDEPLNGTAIPRLFGVGASLNWPVEVKIIGPSDADADVLRGLAKQAETILRSRPEVALVRNDWRQRSLRVQSDYNLQEGGWTGVTREGLASSLKRALDGGEVGLLRRGDELQSIVLVTRADGQQEGVTDLHQLQVRSQYYDESVPLWQVSKNIKWEWYDPLIWRYDMQRTIAVQAVLHQGDATALMAALAPQFEQLEVPPGYRFEFAGEYSSNTEQVDSMKQGVPLAAAVMVLVVVGLFNAFRPCLIVFLVVPFAMIGVFLGHYLTGVELAFISVLGIFSLSGMMIKNAIVLLDEVKSNLASGMTQYQALVDATRSRLLPVFNASLTTVLGLIPLLQDVFWQSMATTVMFGLLVGAVMTVVMVPLLYSLFYNVRPD